MVTLVAENTDISFLTVLPALIDVTNAFAENEQGLILFYIIQMNKKYVKLKTNKT